uniref:Uncharacterized protein n=1 Tax=Vitis vinifera TaxID=29760 RepID=F6H5Y7_VITVI
MRKVANDDYAWKTLYHKAVEKGILNLGFLIFGA